MSALFKGREKFELLTDKRDRGRVLGAIESMVRKARKENVGVVVGLEKSGRPTTLLFMGTWKRMFPRDRLPKLFFIDPDLFEIATGFPEKVKSRLPRLFSELGAIGNRKVLVLDDSAYFGVQTLGVRNAFRKMGVKNVITAVLAKSEPARVDIYGRAKSKKFNDEASRFLALSKTRATGVKESPSGFLSSPDPNPLASAMKRDVKRLAWKRKLRR